MTVDHSRTMSVAPAETTGTLTRVPFYGHMRQYHSIAAEIHGSILRVIASEEYVLGPALRDFELALASYCGTQYAIGVNSGTDALWLALMSCGMGRGDEVITTANTFFGTAEAIWIAGATPVFVDSDPVTHCIDVGSLEAAISRRTRAVIPVHLYGQCADMPAIERIAARHGLVVIEDAAQAMAARGNGFRMAERGLATAVSFIANKNLGTFGDAGAVLTNSRVIRDAVSRLRNHGSEQRGFHSMGFNSRLDDLHAAVLMTKLRHLDRWTSRRRQLAERYTAALAGVPLITLPSVVPGSFHVFHLYVIHVAEPWMREDLLQSLERAGIEAKTHYPIPIHRQAGFPWDQPARLAGPLGATERSAATCISLPLFPELTEAELGDVVDCVREWARSASEAGSARGFGQGPRSSNQRPEHLAS